MTIALLLCILRRNISIAKYKILHRLHIDGCLSVHLMCTLDEKGRGRSSSSDTLDEFAGLEEKRMSIKESVGKKERKRKDSIG